MSARPKEPIRVTAAFYGRTYDKKMPFYGQDANLDTSYSGQRLKQPVKPGLVNFRDLSEANGPWTWSKAHTLFGDREDRSKYTPKGDPLQAEDRIPVMKGWDHLASAYALQSLQREIELHDPATPVGAAMIAAFAREIVKGKKHAFETEFHDEFVHRFREWLRGNGSEAEYREAGMESYVGNNSKRCKNKPISDHPSVIQYLGDWQSRVIDYNTKRTVMKLRLGRQGAYGEAASVDDLWKYYKFVVYGVESDDGVTATADAAILEERSKKTNVIQGPLGAVKITATTPAENLLPLKMEPLPQTSEEQRKDTILLAEVVTDEETIADHKKYVPSPAEERLLEEAYDRPVSPKPKKEEKKEPELPSPPNDPLPELDSGDAELQARADALKKEKKPGPLPKFPKTPTAEPSIRDEAMLDRIAKLQRQDAGVSLDKQRLESIFQATEQLMEQRMQEIHQMEARARAFFERLLNAAPVQVPAIQPAQPANVAPALPAPPAAQPTIVASIQPTPDSPVQPAPATQPVAIPPVVPQPAPADQALRLPSLPAPVPPAAAPATRPPSPDQVKLSTLPVITPEPMPALATPAAASAPASVKKQKPEPEAQPVPARESASNAIERMHKAEQKYTPSAIEETVSETASAELTAWNDMLKAYLEQMPAALQQASNPNATEAERAKAEFLRRATETLRSEIHTAAAAESIAADARQRVRDATHVPNILQTQPGGPAPAQLIETRQSVSLRPGGRTQSFVERVRSTSRRSASPPKRSPPARSPPRSPRKDTPAVSPSPKRKEPEKNNKPISNVRGRKKNTEDEKKGNKKNAKK